MYFLWIAIAFKSWRTLKLLLTCYTKLNRIAFASLFSRNSHLLLIIISRCRALLRDSLFLAFRTRCLETARGGSPPREDRRDNWRFLLAIWRRQVLLACSAVGVLLWEAAPWRIAGFRCGLVCRAGRRRDVTERRADDRSAFAVSPSERRDGRLRGWGAGLVLCSRAQNRGFRLEAFEWMWNKEVLDFEDYWRYFLHLE